MDAARLMSLRNNKTFSASERLTIPLVPTLGPLNCPVPIAVDWLKAPEAKLTPRSVLALRSTLQKRTFNRICSSTGGTSTRSRLTALAERGGNRHDAIGRDHVLYRAAHKGGFVFECDVDIVVGEIARQLLAHRVQTHRAQAHRQIVEQAVAAFLPDDQRGLARRPSR